MKSSIIKSKDISIYLIPGIKKMDIVLTPEIITDVVCHSMNVDFYAIHYKSRFKQQIFLRYIIMYFMRTKLGYTQTNTGIYFRQDHATVLNAERRINNDIEVDRLRREFIERLEYDIETYRTSQIYVNNEITNTFQRFRTLIKRTVHGIYDERDIMQWYWIFSDVPENRVPLHDWIMLFFINKKYYRLKTYGKRKTKNIR